MIKLKYLTFVIKTSVLYSLLRANASYLLMIFVFLIFVKRPYIGSTSMCPLEKNFTDIVI